MKNIILSTLYSSVFEDVMRTTSYLGAKEALGLDDDSVPGPGRTFDRVAVMEADLSIIRRFAFDAACAIGKRLRGVLTGTEQSVDEVKLHLAVSDSFDDGLSENLLSNYSAYITAAVTARWLRLAHPAKESKWETEAAMLADEISGIIFYRLPPKRLKSTQK